MKKLLKAENAQVIDRGEFKIHINFPGLAVGNPSDRRGLAQLGRFDHGFLQPGVFVGMHPHRDDEILSYLRQGELMHEDTHGEKVIINNKKLMMMNAGSGIYHQESIPKEDKEAVEMLQIFMRPSHESLKPAVQFYDFDEAFSTGVWRLVAGYQEDAPLKINSSVSVFDCRLNSGEIVLQPKANHTYVLYVFEGSATVADLYMEKGDLMVLQNEEVSIKSDTTTDLVLFELDPHGTYTRKGMYSGL